MKNYRNLIPVALVVFMALSLYTLFSGYAKSNRKYQAAIEQARAFAADGIMQDSLSMYQEALEMYDTLDLQIEMCDMLSNLGGIENAISIGEEMLDKYSKEAKAYTFMLNLYIQAEMYKECFQLKDKAESIGVINKDFEEAMTTIEYTYKLKSHTYKEVMDFGCGVCPVLKGEEWGYVNEDGEIVIDAMFVSAMPFTKDDLEGEEIICAPVKASDGSGYYIDLEGNKKYVIKDLKQCSYLGPYCEGVLVAADTSGYAYYNLNFEKLSEAYTYASTMNGGAAVIQKDERWFVIDNTYNQTGESYDEFVLDDKNIAFRNDRAFGIQDHQYYLVDSAGNKVTGEAYEEAKMFMSSGYAAVKKDGKWGFIDIDGNMVIPPTYEGANSFSMGLAAVRMDGRWGFIDEKQNIVIPCIYDGAEYFNSSGNVYVCEDEDWTLLSLYKYNH